MLQHHPPAPNPVYENCVVAHGQLTSFDKTIREYMRECEEKVHERRAAVLVGDPYNLDAVYALEAAILHAGNVVTEIGKVHKRILAVERVMGTEGYAAYARAKEDYAANVKHYVAELLAIWNGMSPRPMLFKTNCVLTCASLMPPMCIHAGDMYLCEFGDLVFHGSAVHLTIPGNEVLRVCGMTQQDDAVNVMTDFGPAYVHIETLFDPTTSGRWRMGPIADSLMPGELYVCEGQYLIPYPSTRRTAFSTKWVVRFVRYSKKGEAVVSFKNNLYSVSPLRVYVLVLK